VRSSTASLWIAGIDRTAKRVSLQQLMQEPELLGREPGIHGGDRAIEAGHEAGLAPGWLRYGLGPELRAA
jgi:hypothetical protein